MTAHAVLTTWLPSGFSRHSCVTHALKSSPQPPSGFWIPSSQVAARVTEALTIPTIGIGAGSGTDAQVLVWSDFAGLRSGKAPRFVKKYADLRATLLEAARTYAADVESGAFPAAEHSFES